MPAQNCNITPPLKRKLVFKCTKISKTPNLLLFCQFPLPIIRSQRIIRIITIRITIITRIVFSTAITRVVVVVIVANYCNCNLFARGSCKLVRIKQIVLYLIALVATTNAFASLLILIAYSKESQTSALWKGCTRNWSSVWQSNWSGGKAMQRRNQANLNYINLNLVKVYSIRLIV